MISFFANRAPALAALAATILALGAGAALSKGPRPATAPPRAAVLAGGDATETEIADATTAAYDAGATHIAVRRTGGLPEAQAQAAALAAQGYDVVEAAGPQARAAIGQAASSELPGAHAW